MSQPSQSSISHRTAVLIVATAASIWGLGFPMTRIALSDGMSVGVLMAMRFVVAGVLMAIIVRAKGVPIRRRGVVDGIWLGIVLSTLFWLQTDGMRFTTTAKSGFITGLYVLFTPLIAVAIGQRVKLTSLVGAVIATYGLYLLVQSPGSIGALGGIFGRMNRGDVETLGCALLCAVHIVLMGSFARKSDAWLLASSQVITCGIISAGIAIVGSLGTESAQAAAGLSNWHAVLATLYLALFSTVFAFWAQATAQTRLGPTEAAILFSLEPVVAALLSVFWLKEAMSPRQAFGGGLMVFAMIVAEALPHMFRAITVPDTRP
ncbi:MAG: DMT family transporter [Candidatus Korobacteraceae bacterium]